MADLDRLYIFRDDDGTIIVVRAVDFRGVYNDAEDGWQLQTDHDSYDITEDSVRNFLVSRSGYYEDFSKPQAGAMATNVQLKIETPK